MWRDNSFECFYKSNVSFFGHYTYCDSISMLKNSFYYFKMIKLSHSKEQDKVFE